jgi:hypothetical protein
LVGIECNRLILPYFDFLFNNYARVAISHSFFTQSVHNYLHNQRKKR